MNYTFFVIAVLAAIHRTKARERSCQFSCENDDACLNIYRVCDGKRDCDNGADEEHCLEYECRENQVKCENGLQCIRDNLKCSGSRSYCEDQSDSNQTLCAKYQCSAAYTKCQNGWQCANARHFCNKSSRGRGQYQCLDHSDESIWGCWNVSKSCTASNGLWPCDSNDKFSQCIQVAKVCDGHTGIKTNNCQGEQDEEEEFCRNWKCHKNYLKCRNQLQCILAGNVCDGFPHCLDKSDEEAIELKPGVWDRCNQTGSFCLKYPKRQAWEIEGEVGARCDPETCLEATKFCDGSCDCVSNCFDEDPGYCKTWICSEGYFKCHSSGLCIREDQICDGNFDCKTDSSDEADCPCEDTSGSIYFRDLLVAFLSQFCNGTDLDCMCLRNATIQGEADPLSQLVHLSTDQNCGLRDCTFSSVELLPQDPAIRCQPNKRHLSYKENWFSGRSYQAQVHLPLVLEGYNYSLSIEGQAKSTFHTTCYSSVGISSSLVERIFAKMIHDEAGDGRVCQCDFQRVGRIRFFNDYKLPSAFHIDMRDYFYKIVHKHSGQHELLFTTDLRCQFNGTDLEWNTVYPTVSYGTGTDRDDKNFPLKLFLYFPPWYCEAKLDEPKLDLLTLMGFAISGTMKTKELEEWVTLESDDYFQIEAALCEPDSLTFEYVYNDTTQTYLILSKRSPRFSLSFLVANQRLGLYDSHQLSDMNVTKTINVLVDSVEGSKNLAEIANDKLLHEIFVEHRLNTTLSQYVFSRILLPRQERDYKQIVGYKNLKLALTKAGVHTELAFFRVCLKDTCDMDPISDYRHIEKSLNSRWAKNCLNVAIDQDVYTVLASKVDTFYVLIDLNDTKLTDDPLLATTEVKVHTKSLPGDGTDTPYHPQTKLLEVEGQIFCPNEKVTTFPSFYVSTLVSALIHENQKCVQELCDAQELFFQRDKLNFLGPFNAIWESSCFREFGYELVSDIFESKDRGILTINKFWGFQNYNYMIFSKKGHRKKAAESLYLTRPIFCLEILLGLTMATICLVTILGNLLVFMAIMVDPTTKKSIYQHLQMSLCLADVLMGMAGAGSIVVNQFGLLFGSISIHDFIEADAFTASFKSPEQALRSGLNQFYFITSKPNLLICGALVSLSTTVSLVLIAAMAFTRHQVASSTFRQHRIFAWATRHPHLASMAPWLVGVVFTGLHFFDIFSLQLTFQAFFDPISKLTILLPSSSKPLNFYIQTAIGGMVSMVTVYYSIRAWMAINCNAREIRARGMISQQDQMKRRLAEERNWLHLTVAIIAAFGISVVPVFIFYVLSLFSIVSPPVIQLLVWWLLVSGSFLNLIIYTFLNDKMRRTISISVKSLLSKMKMSPSVNRGLDYTMECSANSKKWYRASNGLRGQSTKMTSYCDTSGHSKPTHQ